MFRRQFPGLWMVMMWKEKPVDQYKAMLRMYEITQIRMLSKVFIMDRKIGGISPHCSFENWTRYEVESRIRPSWAYCANEQLIGFLDYFNRTIHSLSFLTWQVCRLIDKGQWGSLKLWVKPLAFVTVIKVWVFLLATSVMKLDRLWAVCMSNGRKLSSSVCGMAITMHSSLPYSLWSLRGAHHHYDYCGSPAATIEKSIDWTWITLREQKKMSWFKDRENESLNVCRTKLLSGITTEWGSPRLGCSRKMVIRNFTGKWFHFNETKVVTMTIRPSWYHQLASKTMGVFVLQWNHTILHSSNMPQLGMNIGSYPWKSVSGAHSNLEPSFCLSLCPVSFGSFTITPCEELVKQEFFFVLSHFLWLWND